MLSNTNSVRLQDTTGALIKYPDSDAENAFYGASAETGITAYAGGGQTNATALTKGWNNVGTVATAADSVKLPTAALGKVVTVKNSGAAALAVFPSSGGAINGGTADTSVTLQPGEVMVFRGTSTTAWQSIKDDVIISVTTATTPASGSCAVQFTFKNRAGVAISSRRAMLAWLSDANGDVVAAATSLVVLTNGKLTQLVTGQYAHAITSAAGLLGVTVTHAAGTYYMSFQLPDGKIITSGAIVVNA